MNDQDTSYQELENYVDEVKQELIPEELRKAKAKKPFNVYKEGHKMFSALVPEYLFWEFKAEASKRRESMGGALTNAILLYLDLPKEEQV